jgi:hypothetical protein
MITSSLASPSVAHVALAPETNDPLAGMSFMTLFRECVNAARIGFYAKGVLVRIADFVDRADGLFSVISGPLARTAGGRA